MEYFLLIIKQLNHKEDIMQIRLLDLNINEGKKANLISLESNKNIPFEIKRVYYIYGATRDAKRGLHAHKNLKQVAVCVHGSCKFLLDDGITKQHIKLSSPNTGLYLKELIWREMYDFSSDCVLMVLADDFYKEEDYIRNYKDFLQEIKR